MLYKIKKYLFSKEKTCEEVWQEEFEADRLAHPELFREIDLAADKHADNAGYNTGITKEVMAALYKTDGDIAELVHNCNIKLFKQ